MSAGTVSPERMLPKTIPLPGGSGRRKSPVRTPECRPWPFTTTLRAIVRWGTRRGGASGGPETGAPARHLLAHALHQLDAVHLGHPDVHDREPGHRAVERGERRPPVLGLEHLVPLVDEHAAQRLADVRLVVAHQDRLGHVPPPRAPSHPPA